MSEKELELMALVMVTFGLNASDAQRLMASFKQDGGTNADLFCYCMMRNEITG